MQRKTALILAGVGLVAGLGIWFWQRKASAATTTTGRVGSAPVRMEVVTGGVRTTRLLYAGDPGYAELRVKANAIELHENTGAGHF